MDKFLFSLFVSSLLFISCNQDDPIGTTDPGDPIVNLTNKNVLLIIADDTGVEATPGYDIGTIKPNMPRLQQMIDEGILYENTWSYPICAPTRSAILTGKYGYRTGVLNVTTDSRLSNEEKSLHKYIDEETNNSYAHAVFGKWHISGNDINGAEDLGVGTFAGILGGGISNYFNWGFTQNGVTSNTTTYSTKQLTDSAIDWISNQDKNWFCWMAYNAAHTPLHLPPEEMHSQVGLSGDSLDIENNPLPYFMGMMESLDYQMNRLIEAIPADELDNTVIIYIGDNGTLKAASQQPYTNGQFKGSLYQGGIHVPLIVWSKDLVRKGARDQSLVQCSDLFATISDIIGIEQSQYQDSKSFEASFSQENAGLRVYNYSEVLSDNLSKSGYTIRNQDFKLIVFDDGTQELYHLVDDPYEKNALDLSQLNALQNAALLELEEEAASIRS